MRPNEGEQLNIDGIGWCEVLRSDDPSLVTLKRPNGAVLKVGDHALRNMLGMTPAEMLQREEQGQ